MSIQVLKKTSEAPVEKQAKSDQLTVPLDDNTSGIQTIFDSKSMSDEEKEKNIKQQFKLILMTDKQDIWKKFSIEMFKCLQNYIGNCNSGLEKSLLDYVAFAAEKGYDESHTHDLYWSVRESGLKTKLEQLIKLKVEEEEEQEKKQIEKRQFSETVQKLVCAYQLFMNNNDTERNTNEICMKVLQKDLEIILSKFQQKKEATQKELQQAVITMQTPVKIRDKYGFFHYQINSDLVYGGMIPLFHLNCDPHIGCLQCITVHQPGTQEFHSAVMDSIGEITLKDVQNSRYFSSNFQQNLTKNHKIIDHLSFQIINFANSNPLQSKQHKDANSTLENPSVSYIASVVKMLFNILNQNEWNCSTAQNTPKLLESIGKLAQIKFLEPTMNEKDIDSICRIKYNFLKCMRQIQQFGDDKTLERLTNNFYAHSLVLAIASCGGSSIQNNDVIEQAALNTEKFFTELFLGRNKAHEFFGSQKSLAKISLEQSEEEGGYEEVDAWLKVKNKDFQTRAKYAINAMSNFYEYGKSYYEPVEEDD
ncbi:MAG: hypothetical protein EZS28_002950 [Streblomastix strix]|uniref:Uncharacterized protein n=1 Tax=Streblomastix strix TaxID=222440 RepID=A0A5J4X459_9EUKA|nr:MAG: hypothetical protein EZS28_002950 [Streblomastix strix]